MHLIQAVSEMAKEKWLTEIFEGIDLLPHFNPDLDTAVPPEKVAVFRKKLRGADGLLICTPEYAKGIPGTLKNAIDWTVSSMEFHSKPVALITAASSGHKAHSALIDTLNVIEAKLTPDTQLLISFIKTKVNTDGEIINKETLRQVSSLIGAFERIMEPEMQH
jgi:chromate reductase, NAD(P)H dehydrogenase (quinone)